MSYSSMNTGSGLITQYLGEAFPKLLKLYERLPEIMVVSDSITNSITSNFNLQTQAYVYNLVGTEFKYAPFVVGTTANSELEYSLTADRNEANWSIDPATGFITRTLDGTDIGETLITITVTDSSISETRTSTIRLITFADIESVVEPIDITLDGDRLYTITQGDDWTDPGVSYNVTPEVHSSVSEVDTAVPGIYFITYTAEALGITAKAVRVVEVKAPAEVIGNTSIALVGAPIVHIAFGSNWSDPGYEETNAVSTTTAGTVDTNTASSYLITYTANAANGSTDTVYRTVIVDPKYTQADIFANDAIAFVDTNTASTSTDVTIPLTNRGVNDYTLTGISSDPTHGSLSSITSSSVLYTPDLDYVGSDSFEFTVSTSGGEYTATGTAHVVIGLPAGTVTFLTNLDAKPTIVDCDYFSTERILPFTDVNVPAGWSIEDNGIDLTATPATVSASASIVVGSTGYTLSWAGGYEGVITHPIKIGNSVHSYWTNIVFNIIAQKNPLNVFANPADVVLDVGTTSSDIHVVSSAYAAQVRVKSVSSSSYANITKLNATTITYIPTDTTAPFEDSIPVTYEWIDDTNYTITRNTVIVYKAADTSTQTLPQNYSLICEFNTANTLDISADIGTATVANVSSATNGTASVTNDVLAYTPNQYYTGNDSFTYTLDNGNTATVYVYVKNWQGVFRANNFYTSTAYNTPVTFDPFINDFPNNAIYINNLTPSNGTVSKTGSSYTYTPSSGFSGTDSFVYTIQNPNVLTEQDSAKVWIEVLPDGAGAGGGGGTSGSVTANDDTAEVTQDGTVNINVKANDDPGVTLDAITVAPLHGTASINGAQLIAYTPDAGYYGADTLTYRIKDLSGNTDTAVVTITVTQASAGNTAPTITLLGDNPMALTVGANSTIDLENFTAGSYTGTISAPGKSYDGQTYSSIKFTSPNGTVDNTDSRFSQIQIDASSITSVILNIPSSMSTVQYELRSNPGNGSIYYGSDWIDSPNGTVTIDLTAINHSGTVYIAIWALQSDIPVLQSGAVNINSGTAFIDPGATATDTDDGDLTSSIVATGTVDVSTVGAYTRTYSVTDSGGLTTTVDRTVNVVAGASVTSIPIDFLGNDVTINQAGTLPEQLVIADNADTITVKAGGSTYGQFITHAFTNTITGNTPYKVSIKFNKDTTNEVYSSADTGVIIGFSSVPTPNVVTAINVRGLPCSTIMGRIYGYNGDSSNLESIMSELYTSADTYDGYVSSTNTFKESLGVTTQADLWEVSLEVTDANNAIYRLYLNNVLKKQAALDVTGKEMQFFDASGNGTIQGLTFTHKADYNVVTTYSVLSNITATVGAT